MNYFFSPETLAFVPSLCCPICSSKLSKEKTKYTCGENYPTPHNFTIFSTVDIGGFVYLAIKRNNKMYYAHIRPSVPKTLIQVRGHWDEFIFDDELPNFMPESIPALLEIIDTYLLFY